MTPLPPFIVGALVGVGFLLGMVAGIALDEHARNERDRIYNPIRDMAWSLGAVVVALLVVLGCAGCATSASHDTAQSFIEQLQGEAQNWQQVADDAQEHDEATDSADTGDDTSEVVGSDVPAYAGNGRDADVTGWAQTATLYAAYNGSRVSLNYDKANVWPSMDFQGTALVANPWVIAKKNGLWHASTWEWLRPGQTSKSMPKDDWGSHIKTGELATWNPSQDEVFYLMVSGLCRSATRNVRERSNYVAITMHRGRGLPRTVTEDEIDMLDALVAQAEAEGAVE